jgi:hypothetical protein
VEGIRTDSAAARLIAQALGEETFTLIDVGCSGGVDPGWAVFGDRLRAYAFDISLTEVARLQAQETRPGVEYIAGRVDLPAEHPLQHDLPSFNWWRRNPWGRLAVGWFEARQAGRAGPIASAADAAWGWPYPDPLDALPSELGPGVIDPALAHGASAARGAPDDPEQHRTLMAANRWQETELAGEDARLHLPSFLAARGVDDVDFIKIDVDGPDYSILVSLGDVLTDARVIGVTAEVTYCGGPQPHHNTFHNTDRFLRRRGFDLFGLTTRGYASAALPTRFEMAMPAQALCGRPIQGDALYARDTGWKGEHEVIGEWPAGKLLKLAALFALFGLPDQAAEVLLRHRDTLSARLDVDAALDALTEEAWPGLGLSHAELLRRFEANDPMFYPSTEAAAALPAQPPALESAAAEARAAAAEVEMVRLQQELAALRASSSWRVTAPLRSLVQRFRG